MTGRSIGDRQVTSPRTDYFRKSGPTRPGSLGAPAAPDLSTPAGAGARTSSFVFEYLPNPRRVRRKGESIDPELRARQQATFDVPSLWGRQILHPTLART